jgi:hypothetical protein
VVVAVISSRLSEISQIPQRALGELISSTVGTGSGSPDGKIGLTPLDEHPIEMITDSNNKKSESDTDLAKVLLLMA